MSRHILVGINPEHDIVVGWDPGLATYFAQVFPCHEQEGEEYRAELLWAGTSPGEIPNTEQLANVLRKFATIPDDIVSQLKSDMQREVAGSVFLDSLIMRKPQ